MRKGEALLPVEWLRPKQSLSHHNHY